MTEPFHFHVGGRIYGKSRHPLSDIYDSFVFMQWPDPSGERYEQPDSSSVRIMDKDEELPAGILIGGFMLREPIVFDEAEIDALTDTDSMEVLIADAMEQGLVYRFTDLADGFESPRELIFKSPTPSITSMIGKSS